MAPTDLSICSLMRVNGEGANRGVGLPARVQHESPIPPDQLGIDSRPSVGFCIGHAGQRLWSGQQARIQATRAQAACGEHRAPAPQSRAKRNSTGCAATKGERKWQSGFRQTCPSTKQHQCSTSASPPRRPPPGAAAGCGARPGAPECCQGIHCPRPAIACPARLSDPGPASRGPPDAPCPTGDERRCAPTAAVERHTSSRPPPHTANPR